jgi:hypothetical protein
MENIILFVVGILMFGINKMIKLNNFFDFYKHLEPKWLYLPNVKANLKKLYQGIFAYIKDFDDIQAIIIFGSAIRYPKIIKYTRKKYFLFGEPVEIEKEIPYEPRDVDVLIITDKPYFDKKYIEPKVEEWTNGSSCWEELVYAGYDIMNRSISQIKEGLKKYDTISMNALREGVVLTKRENFNINQFDIQNQSKRNVTIEDNNLKLNIIIN